MDVEVTATAAQVDARADVMDVMAAAVVALVGPVETVAQEKE